MNKSLHTRNTSDKKENILEPFKRNLWLLICDIILILAVIFTVITYSRTIMKQKRNLKLDSFCSTVESMKKVSDNYLYTEKGYVLDWAKYISSHDMTAEEALDYINATNSQKDREAHLVNMDDMSARSTYAPNDNPWIKCYEDMASLNTNDSNYFLDKMRRMFNSSSDEILILGKYRIGESQRTVISVGTRVNIKEDDNSTKAYLLLRAIPVEHLQKSWAFPTAFSNSEISMIVKDGGYVVSSPSLRSKSFLDFIRAYNYPDDYNKIDELAQKLKSTDSGILEYKDSKGQDCYFYYSNFGNGSDIDILGYIPVADMQIDNIDWSIVLIICIAILLLIFVNGIHLLSINRRLRKSYNVAEKASNAKTQFLSSMSHDIRTPMNAVIGMTEIAKHHIDEPDYIKSCLDKISTSGTHLLTLINDILDISKVESGKMSLKPQPFSLKKLVDETASIIQQSADENGIEFNVSIHDISHDIIVADTLRIRQILVNLLTNSIKYTESTGHVTFDISENAVSNSHNMTELVFVISDDGIGMSEEYQRTMYDSFSRGTDSRINTIQGSGLGLSIVNQMVRLMNGNISCDSTLGVGTTFTVRLILPIANELPADTQLYTIDSSNTTDQFKGMRVLVTEDNNLNWEIIHILLDEQGIISDRALNGQICLDILNAADSPRYDVVFMDIQMPVMNGRDATRYMRSSSNSYIRNMPVAAMTADAFADDVYACLEAGMDAHISKPIDMKQVLSILQKVKNGTLHRKEEN